MIEKYIPSYLDNFTSCKYYNLSYELWLL
jgi:hypothetical protein